VANPFVAEIRIVPFNFAPKGWAFCNGQLMPISQNTALFSLLGTTYGGDGKATFALPNLQGSAPLHPGQGPGLSLRDLGEAAGESVVTLLQTEIPSHNHVVNCVNSAGSQLTPGGSAWAAGVKGQKVYATTPGNAQVMNSGAISVAGSSFPHNNMPPYLVLNFIIALQGVYPPRT
jgi:microcystin-dependent protein